MRTRNIEVELKKLGVMQERLDAYKIYANAEIKTSLDWTLKYIVGLSEEDIEYIKYGRRIKKVRDWKKNN